MGWPHTAWTLAGYGARALREIIGSRLVELLEELMGTMRHIAFFCRGLEGNRQQACSSSCFQ